LWQGVNKLCYTLPVNDPMKLLEQYKAYLVKNFDPVRAEKEKAYLYSDLKHYGIPSPVRGKYCTGFDKEITALSKKEALKLAKKAWAAESFEEKMFGLGILNLHLAELDLTDMPFIEQIMRESRGWALLDSSIVPFMPTILTKFPSAYSYLKKWIKDKDFWVRRSALLAQLLFFRANKGGDKKLFFDFAKSQFDETWIDKEYKATLMRSRARFFIRKAIGWILRDMSVKDPESVVKFLNENKGQMSGLSYKEGSRKLTPAYKKQLK
jgi:3-methyladenine DNA glycosylase AlkD